jgi:hypothetical protein
MVEREVGGVVNASQETCIGPVIYPASPIGKGKRVNKKMLPVITNSGSLNGIDNLGLGAE